MKCHFGRSTIAQRNRPSFENRTKKHPAGRADQHPLASIKVVSGIVGNSYALLADGIESAMEVLSSLSCAELEIMNMMIRSWIFTAILTLSVLISGESTAQIANTEILQVKSHYDDLKFQQAINSSDSLLHANRQLLPEELAFLHQYLALSYYNLGALDSSRVHFLSLLSLRPNTALDPGEISPKIIEFFDQIKSDTAVLLGKSADPQFFKYVVAPDKRRDAAWRSALIPGWGQSYKGQKARGIVLGGAFWASFAATIAVALQEENSKQAYVDARDPGEISSEYDTYNKWFKTRRILTITTVALWAITVGDALLSPYPQPSLTFHPTGEILVGLQLSP